MAKQNVNAENLTESYAGVCTECRNPFERGSCECGLLHLERCHRCCVTPKPASRNHGHLGWQDRRQNGARVLRMSWDYATCCVCGKEFRVGVCKRRGTSHWGDLHLDVCHSCYVAGAPLRNLSKGIAAAAQLALYRAAWAGRIRIDGDVAG